MYLTYVDESGDTGLTGSPTRYFALSALTVHESRWRDLASCLVAFRRTMRSAYGLPIRVEIHASEYLRRPPVPGIQKHVRLAILRNLLDEIGKLNYVSVTNVVVKKAGKPAGYDVFELAWQTLFQRIENTIRYGNFPGGYASDKGMMFVDNTDGKKLLQLTRRMSVHNPIPNLGGGGYRNLPLLNIIEDPHHKDSQHSYLIQVADVNAYFLHQKYAPSKYILRQGARHYLNRLGSALNSRASRTNGFGIVEL